jgi:hypothetical protein
MDEKKQIGSTMWGKCIITKIKGGHGMYTFEMDVKVLHFTYLLFLFG